MVFFLVISINIATFAPRLITIKQIIAYRNKLYSTNLIRV